MQLYRIQLERELKTRLLLLRRKYIGCSGKTESVARLMIASVSTFLVLLRAALRLYNEAAPTEKTKAAAELTKYIQFDPQPLLAVQQLKQQPHQPTAGEVEASCAVFDVNRTSRAGGRSAFAFVVRIARELMDRNLGSWDAAVGDCRDCGGRADRRLGGVGQQSTRRAARGDEGQVGPGRYGAAAAVRPDPQLGRDRQRLCDARRKSSKT